MRPDPLAGAPRSPRAWLATRRGRRLGLVILLFPGAALAIAGAQILLSPPMVGVGLAWLAVGLAVSRLIAGRFPPLATLPRPDCPDPEESAS